MVYHTNGHSLETNFPTAMATAQPDQMKELVQGVDVHSRAQRCPRWREVRLRKPQNGDRGVVLAEAKV